MMKKKGLVLMVMLFCMAACITAQETKAETPKELIIVDNLDAFMKAIKEQKIDISFVVAYGQKFGEPVVMAPGPGSYINDKISSPVDMTAIYDPLCKEKFVEIKTMTIFSAYGSPGMHLVTLPSGRYVLVKVPQ